MITLKELFEQKIMYRDDDFYLLLNGEVVADNRKEDDPNVIPYLDYPIIRISHSTGRNAIRIELQPHWSHLG